MAISCTLSGTSRVGSQFVKKGRHRRFEEARDLKRAISTAETEPEPCPECGAEPGREHASWCLAMEDEGDEFEGEGDEDEELGQDNGVAGGH
jgi:hypothetical protein